MFHLSITNCLCHSISFEAILEQCRAKGILALDDLACQLNVASSCQLCHPYLRAALETGQTEFSQ